MPAIRLLDTEHQTELAYLHEQLITGEPVQDKSWRYAEEYLMQLGIYNVILVEENDVRNYKRFLLEDRDCTIREANSMTSFLRNKKAHWIEQEYGALLEEIRQCEGIEMPLTGNIKNFLIREGIHHIREIDYAIREKYEQYLMKEKKPEQVLRYLKTLDRIKQYHIRQEMKQFANTKKFHLRYEQQILFLPYLPDQKLAMEFDKVRDKTELVWDFSVKASEKMKQQIFQLLIHILENVKDPKDRRVRFLLPMQWMYQYCIKQGIADCEYVFKTHDYRHTLATQFYDDGVPIQTIRDYLGHVAEEMTKQYVDYMPKKIEKANDNYFDKPENNIALTITPKKRRHSHEKG